MTLAPVPCPYLERRRSTSDSKFVAILRPAEDAEDAGDAGDARDVGHAPGETPFRTPWPSTPVVRPFLFFLVSRFGMPGMLGMLGMPVSRDSAAHLRDRRLSPPMACGRAYSSRVGC